MTSTDKVGSRLVEVAPGKSGGADSPSVSPIYRSALASNGFRPQKDDARSLFEVFENSVRAFPDRPCLGRRINGTGPYVWESYKEVHAKVQDIGSGLATIGVAAREKAAVFSVNCPEWMMVLQACNRMNIFTVPLYDTLGPEAIEYCLQHSESKAVFVNSKNWASLMNSLPALKDQIQTVIYWGTDAISTQTAADLGLKVYSLHDFIALGKQNPAQPRPASPEDLCTIMYTSGTTGPPKGVMIPQTMMLACMGGMSGCLLGIETVDQLSEHDIFLSFLPLAHIFDRMIEEQILSYGGAIGYFSGDVKKLVDDISALKPTVFIGVPRVWDRIYAGVMDQITKAGGIKKFLFEFGFAWKLWFLERGYSFANASPFFDKLLFSKIKQRLGGNVRIALSGAAPLSKHVEEFLAVALCCHFSQGYGLTETCGCSYLATGEATMFGSVGIANPCLEYRLESIPEMKYEALAKYPKGEVCIRGPSVSPGYYKDPEKTAEAFDKEGWFHTGDVGEVMPSGSLKIIDRKKQIFKLAQGEYVAVERVEANYKKLPIIAQLFVYGNSMESMLVAVVVPEENLLLDAAKKEGISGSYTELLGNPKTKEMLLKQMEAVAAESKMRGFEKVRGLILEEEQFSVENGLMTPTFKLRRHQLQGKYATAFAKLYKELNAAKH